jgi:Leucine-rich repeat (LRR) protein
VHEQGLHLSGEKLKSLPSQVLELTGLHLLDLENNDLEELPEDFENLNNLTGRKFLALVN